MPLPTYFHVMTPSVSTMKVAGLAASRVVGVGHIVQLSHHFCGIVQHREGDTQLPSDVLCAAEVVHADGNHLRVQGLYVVVSPCQLAELSPAVSSPKGPVEDHYQILVVPVGLQ